MRRPRQYTARAPQASTASYYPQMPAPILDNPSVIEKFDTDTLFFLFYFQQGTWQQYVERPAARA